MIGIIYGFEGNNMCGKIHGYALCDKNHVNHFCGKIHTVLTKFADTYIFLQSVAARRHRRDVACLAD